MQTTERYPWLTLVIFLALWMSVEVMSRYLWINYNALQQPIVAEFIHKPLTWFFGAISSIIYALAAVAGWMVWCKSGGIRRRPLLMVAFFLQLFFNIGWLVAFFSWQNVIVSWIIALALVITYVFTWKAWLPEHLLAAYCLIPYGLWISYLWLGNTWMIL